MSSKGFTIRRVAKKTTQPAPVVSETASTSETPQITAQNRAPDNPSPPKDDPSSSVSHVVIDKPVAASSDMVTSSPPVPLLEDPTLVKVATSKPVSDDLDTLQMPVLGDSPPMLTKRAQQPPQASIPSIAATTVTTVQRQRLPEMTQRDASIPPRNDTRPVKSAVHPLRQKILEKAESYMEDYPDGYHTSDQAYKHINSKFISDQLFTFLFATPRAYFRVWGLLFPLLWLLLCIIPDYLYGFLLWFVIGQTCGSFRGSPPAFWFIQAFLVLIGLFLPDHQRGFCEVTFPYVWLLFTLLATGEGVKAIRLRPAKYLIRIVANLFLWLLLLEWLFVPRLVGVIRVGPILLTCMFAVIFLLRYMENLRAVFMHPSISFASLSQSSHRILFLALLGAAGLELKVAGKDEDLDALALKSSNDDDDDRDCATEQDKKKNVVKWLSERYPSLEKDLSVGIVDLFADHLVASQFQWLRSRPSKSELQVYWSKVKYLIIYDYHIRPRLVRWLSALFTIVAPMIEGLGLDNPRWPMRREVVKVLKNDLWNNTRISRNPRFVNHFHIPMFISIACHWSNLTPVHMVVDFSSRFIVPTQFDVFVNSAAIAGALSFAVDAPTSDALKKYLNPACFYASEAQCKELAKHVFGDLALPFGKNARLSAALHYEETWLADESELK